jgi:hypothetical protein
MSTSGGSTGGSGVTQLTGDVTAGPGTGSEVATLVATTNVENIIAANSTVASKAPLASPALTGVPTAPTAAPGTNTTQIATTAFVDAAAGGYPAITSPDSSVIITGSGTAVVTLEVNGSILSQATLAGTGVPSSALGANGDYYLDIGTTAGTAYAYGPKSAGAWGAIVNTIGGSGGGGTTVNRTTSATVGAGENTVFTGSTAAQTLTLPTSPSTSAIPNTIMNNSSQTVTLAPGAAQTLNSGGAVGSLTIPVLGSVKVVLVGTVWYQMGGLSWSPAGSGASFFLGNGDLNNVNVNSLGNGTGGASNVAGTIQSTPPNSSAVATALGATLVLGTSFHNTLSYDIQLTCYLAVTANTSLVVSLGVGSAAGPTQNTIITGTVATGIVPIKFTIPKGYYALLSTSGTATDALVGQYVEAS